MRTGRPKTGRQPNISIRINPEIYHKARVAAVTRKLTIGGWLEEAINEKIDREKQGRKDEQLI
jgi:predicted HicB family RNase H-like nuclease